MTDRCLHRSPIGDDETPAVAGDIPLGGTAVQLAASSGHTCARLDTGTVRCWGTGESGKLGHASVEYIGNDEPVSAVGDVPLGGPAVEIVAGSEHTCARMTTGAIRCWGSSQFGQLGYGNTLTIGDDEPAGAAGDVPVE